MNSESKLYGIVANHDRGEYFVEVMEVSKERAMDEVTKQRNGRKIDISFYEGVSMEAAVKVADEKYPNYHRLGTLKDVLKTLESDPK